MKKELIQLIDVKQRQKVYLTPVDSERQLLKTKPAWDNIKNGQFIIISGQHSITASQELQKEGCGEERREQLQHWDAFIVWSFDHVKLRNISKFYNITNHLDHAQPTWGNQIIACRNMWKTYKRATNDSGEATRRGNGAVFNVNHYKVNFCAPFLSLCR